MGRRQTEVKYLTFEQAVDYIGRLPVGYPDVDTALLSLRKTYAETPSFINDGDTLNVEGLSKMEFVAGQTALEAMNQLVLNGNLSWQQAVERVKDAREFQTKAWPSVIEPDRTFEEWILLTEEYQHRFNSLDLSNLERRTKYAAIVVNLALWAVQAAKGQDTSTIN